MAAMSFVRCNPFAAINACSAKLPQSTWLTSPASRSTRFFCQATPAASNLQPPDVARLAETARITLSPKEVEDLGPKIRQVVDWFGQLQAVNLEDLEPALRADTQAAALPREDTPAVFDNRKDILTAVPNFDDPYIKVPKVLNIE